MSETLTAQPALFELEAGERQLTLQEVLMQEYEKEIADLTVEQLEALRFEELETLSDTENRIHRLNRLIDERNACED